MLKIAICDDDEKICNLLENYINDSCRMLHIEQRVLFLGKY